MTSTPTQDTVFWTTLALASVLNTMMVATLFVSNLRFWPPPNRWSLSYWTTWTLFGALAAGILWLGVLDSGSLGYDHWSRSLIGGLLVCGGTALALWGVYTLSVRASLGLENELTTSGPYRYSRNPQYVGDFAILVGYAVLSNSALTGATALLTALWFVLAPFAEEPWLKKKYGKDYLAYKAQHSRFIGLPH